MDIKTARQLLKEFWLPLCLAIGWTGFRLWSVQSHKLTVADTIATFSPAFFLVSWATGQIVRVRKQARTEDSFKAVEQRLLTVTKNLEEASRDIVAHVTGGESFCYLSFYSDGAPAIMAVHHGDHPIYSVTARAVDVDDFQRRSAAGQRPLGGEAYMNIGDLPPNMARPIVSEIAAKNCQKMNIFFSARNGTWTQLVRRSAPFASAAAAIRVQRNKRNGELEIMFEQIPPDLNVSEIDWS